MRGTDRRVTRTSQSQAGAWRRRFKGVTKTDRGTSQVNRSEKETGMGRDLDVIEAWQRLK